MVKIWKGMKYPDCLGKYNEKTAEERRVEPSERFVNSPETYRLLTEARNYFLIKGVIKRRPRVFSPEPTNKCAWCTWETQQDCIEYGKIQSSTPKKEAES